MRHILKPYLLTLIFLVLAPGVSAAANQHCRLEFKVVADNEIGSISAGDELQGTINFTTPSSWEQDEETVSYETEGTMVLSANNGRGSVRGNVGVVHVVRSPYTADYIAVDITAVTGDLGGQHQYVDPMLVRLYGDRETLTTYDLPTNDIEWNALSQRKFFQVYTPTTADTFNGPIENLKGTCS